MVASSVTRSTWLYRLRVYTPWEFANLLVPIGRVRLFKGNGPGTMILPVHHRAAYFALNNMRNFALTGPAARFFSRFALPLSARLHSHNAALVEVA